MKLRPVLAVATLLGLLAVAAAFADETPASLPAGQTELTDLMSPEDIYADLVRNGDDLDLGADATDASPRDAKVYVLVSKAHQHLWVYVDGRAWGDWAVSTGTEEMRCPPAPASCRIAHTPTGLRHPGRLDWEHFSTLYGNAPMHRAIQFEGGIFFHATYGAHLQRLGHRDSGGCVRQAPENAEKLFLLVRDVVRAYGREAVLLEISEQ